ncbi:enoyl-CoA hydratase-related protein [Thalassomonas sp. M1454]|uniref:enoyl-CoA hydratase-related protein n=1 Tax=Thalassomonas sp. M1454 TaxID=2594477 RepID=UPI00117DEDF1|nr:enoyl-CoA hydratase-related protein [Thalassomonas sp. M1454]TRX57456.1 crotonase [Thalassomonas sp. M1454]
MSKFILSEELNGVLRITLNRLDKKNALNTEMYQQLAALLRTAAKTGSVHCVLIQGDSSCFCAGNDLDDFIKTSDSDDLAAFEFITELAAFEKPIVAAVAGAAVGIGTTILLHCDMVIAATNSKFKLPFTQLGLCPEAGSSFLLPRLIGQQKAFELMVLGKLFSADEAVQYGIANEACSPEEVLSKGLNVANTIAALPLDALLTSRKLIRDASKQQLNEVMAAEVKEFARLVKGEECKSILKQFFK